MISARTIKGWFKREVNSRRVVVYVFKGFVRKDAVVSVAPRAAVEAVFGGGGLYGLGGLSSVFGGGLIFKDGRRQYLGVWGARNASRFRSALRSGGFDLDIVQSRPPGRHLLSERQGKRPIRKSNVGVRSVCG